MVPTYVCHGLALRVSCGLRVPLPTVPGRLIHLLGPPLLPALRGASNMPSLGARLLLAVAGCALCCLPTAAGGGHSLRGKQNFASPDWAYYHKTDSIFELIELYATKCPVRCSCHPFPAASSWRLLLLMAAGNTAVTNARRLAGAVVPAGVGHHRVVLHRRQLDDLHCDRPGRRHRRPGADAGGLRRACSRAHIIGLTPPAPNLTRRGAHVVESLAPVLSTPHAPRRPLARAIAPRCPSTSMSHCCVPLVGWPIGRA